MEYHRPVMLEASIDALVTSPEGVYVDATFGGGGHSRAILERLHAKGRLLAFDQDRDAAAIAQQITDSRFTFIHANFKFIRHFLEFHGITNVNGLFADLGVSSHQLDTAERGFSTRFDGPLDMRMDASQVLTAAAVVNTYTQQELHKILGMYGEIKNAKTLAGVLVQARANREIKSTHELIAVLKPLAPREKVNKYYAQVFQALRIEVNAELDVLEDFLLEASQIICPEGRLVVLTYHSLEDRPVKNFIQKGKCFGEVEKDFFGNVQRPFDPLFRQAIVAENEEILRNPRARSAKLRAGIKR